MRNGGWQVACLGLRHCITTVSSLTLCPCFPVLPEQEAKLKAKKAKVWQERLKTQAEQQQAKQQK